MIISRSDAKQLAQRAQRLHDQAASRMSGELMDLCTGDIFRSLADGAKAHRICRASGCRRARRCTSRAFHCSRMLQRLRMEIDASPLVQERYWQELQRLIDEDAVARRRGKRSKA